MSRIHEALQRAAEEAGEQPADAELPLRQTADASSPDAAGQAIDALAHEPYPVELASARRNRAPVLEPPPPPTEPRHDEPRQAEPPPRDDARAKAEPGPRERILFERLDERLAEKVVVDSHMSAASREQYRRLAAVLHDTQGNRGIRAVMVASALPGEGKTLTATNLALTLSDSYRRRVLLIDADLRRPTLHEVFRLNTASGLSDGLDAQSDATLVVRQISPHLSVLPAGRPTADPMAGLTSDRMRRLIDEAKEAFDWIIIDTPPLMLLPDAHLLSSLVDGAVLVVKANSTAHEMVKRTAEIIGKARVLGVVLNHADVSAQPGYGGYLQNYYLPARGNGNRP